MNQDEARAYFGTGREQRSIAAIVVDIEGTTSPTASVRALYDYTYQRLPGWLNSAGEGYTQGVITLTRRLSGRPDADVAEVTEILQGWLKADVKAEPLKLAQGIICEEGFRTGELRGQFFHDVIPALIMWHASGYILAVFSSGSITNQKCWFGHSQGLIDQWFDLSTGPKNHPSSYDTIADALNLPPQRILFLSDHPDELDAAAERGWKVLGVARPDEPHHPPGRHRWISSFTEAVTL